jgi:hypothetical protein
MSKNGQAESGGHTKTPEPDPAQQVPSSEELYERSRKALAMTPEQWFLERLHLIPESLRSKK